MDLLKNNNNDSTMATGQAPAAGAGAEKQDYGDKAFDMMAKKAGHPVERNTGEKITDAARSAFEKTTNFGRGGNHA
ncbi:hypothetical protein MAPG_11945 [Magnaporthiopsis poae ATCC 64411]|uniref:Uncharacterized protein n=1 Tax=Magnaporthiopsis poae (strain ATCC 64411 / 73-15) TaxID=644358 RepID=A0A0C4EGJ2_MAGP6|nr:hypothetical protein MAPG_11945 [Magnaporthiopsis poae ATCC 64411]